MSYNWKLCLREKVVYPFRVVTIELSPKEKTLRKGNTVKHDNVIQIEKPETITKDLLTEILLKRTVRGYWLLQ